VAAARLLLLLLLQPQLPATSCWGWRAAWPGGACRSQPRAADRAAGASGDLQQVGAMARQMVLQYGMSDVGPWALQQQGAMSDALRRRVDAAVRAMAAEAYAAALAHVRANREALDCAAQALLDQEVLSGEEFRALLAQFTALPGEQAQLGRRRGAAHAAAAERTEL
jgi:cell division protease FtsH